MRERRLRGRTVGVLCGMILMNMSTSAWAQLKETRWIAANQSSGLPLVMPNDNVVTAGQWKDGILYADLELVWSEFRPETPDRPGIKLYALSEKGQKPQIPGPMIRIKEGDRVSVGFTNTHPDSSIEVFGFYKRPLEESNSFVLEPGEQKRVEFEAGKAGTYLYRVNIGRREPGFGYERQQLSGAFIIDPTEGSPDDQVMVMNIFSIDYDSTYEHPYLETLTINGRSWPFTKRITPEVGDTLNWRVINGSGRGHPMHLHGFYYDILSRGNEYTDSIYPEQDQRKVVTENMTGFTTMALKWVPSRPGNWVFHCHLAFHVSPEIRLPGSDEVDDQHIHMAGLVMGIEVRPGSSDLISRGVNRALTLIAKQYDVDSTYKYGFTLDENFMPGKMQGSTPGPLLVMKQYQTTEVTVVNKMKEPTGVHWHGLEIDSWSDGVPNYSASDGKMSPIIKPGQSFTYKLSHMRPGTFMYHSHLNDIDQLTGGLYGALLVLAEEEQYDPSTDHVYMMQWRRPDPNSLDHVEVNGIQVSQPQPDMKAKVGQSHRLRLINIAPAGRIMLQMSKDSTIVPLKIWAKDGADLPISQQVMVEASPRIGVGETVDFIFTPQKEGTYELFVGFNKDASTKQKWIVEK